MKNYGESPWDGPVCLSDMMYDMPDDIRNIFSDYKLNLVQMFDEQQKIARNNSTIQAIKNMLDLGLTKEQILTKYTPEEFAMAEKAMASK